MSELTPAFLIAQELEDANTCEDRAQAARKARDLDKARELEILARMHRQQAERIREIHGQPEEEHEIVK